MSEAGPISGGAWLRRLDPTTCAAQVGGSVLALATAAVARARVAPKPLHPRGRNLHAQVFPRPGAAARFPWLETKGEPAQLRLSTAVGLPFGWPEIAGIAWRVPHPDGPIDILMASTGRSRWSRYLLVPTTDPRGHWVSTLLPYRSTGGAVHFGIAADPADVDHLVVMSADATGPWRAIADLVIGDAANEISFDPIRHTPPGLDHYPWIARLRDPAYRTARRLRGEPGGPDGATGTITPAGRSDG